MAKDENEQGNGTLVVILIIVGTCLLVMAYCAIRHALDPPPPPPPDMSKEQRDYMRRVRERGFEQLRYTAQSKY
ncbi:hypothetical protein BBP40_010900 [Aspergillus hancockii]|nr:hypothetical protein BBP40_010900 [Aspergillus hancockii]